MNVLPSFRALDSISRQCCVGVPLHTVLEAVFADSFEALYVDFRTDLLVSDWFSKRVSLSEGRFVEGKV